MTTHTEKMQVHWFDTDASGLIHYTAALRYFEVAEYGLIRKIFGQPGYLVKHGIRLPRIHVEADYKEPLRFPDEFECTARVTEIGRTSVTYGYEARRSRDGSLCLSGKIVAVAIDAEGGPTPLPREFRDQLQIACSGARESSSS